MLEDVDPRRPRGVRLAVPGRLDGRLPARGRPDAFADAGAAAERFRGHLRAHRAVPARVRWASARTPSTSSASTVAGPKTPIHPELAESLADILGRHPRRDRLPGAGDGRRAEGRAATPSDRPTCCVARWARRRRRSWTRSSPRSPRACAPTATARPRSRSSGRPWSRSPTTRSTKRTRAGYGLVSYWTAYLKAHFPAEYMAALLTSRPGRQGQERDLPATNAGGWASRCCRRTSTSPTPTSRRAAPISVSGSAAIRNVGGNVVESIARSRASQGPVRRFPRFPAQGRGDRLQQARRRVADQGRRFRFARSHRAAACCSIHAEAIDACMDTKRAEAAGQFSLFGGPGEAPSRCPAPDSTSHSAGGVGQEEPAGLRARDARALRLRPSAARCRAHHSPPPATRPSPTC